MIARLEVTRGSLTEYPLAEKVCGGWQNGVMFYPDAEVTKVTPLIFRNETPTDDEREDMIAFLLRDHNFEESPWGRTYTDAEIANALRRSEVPEPRRRMPKRLVNQLRRASGALEEYEFEGVLGDAPGLMNSAADLIEREWGSRPEPQGEPSDAQVNRDYLAQVIHKAVYSRIPLDDLTDEAQADTYKRADAVVAALRAAGGAR